MRGRLGALGFGAGTGRLAVVVSTAGGGGGEGGGEEEGTGRARVEAERGGAAEGARPREEAALAQVAGQGQDAVVLRVHLLSRYSLGPVVVRASVLLFLY